MSLRRSVITLAFLCVVSGLFPASATAEGKGAAARVAEVRRSFTLDGRIIPPGIFRDFGDGNLADGDGIWVTVDLAAAVGSNLYYDPVREFGEWKIEKKQRSKTDTSEETAYAFKGSTANGLIVVVASYNGGGSGTFHTLHILDIVPATGFDSDGKRYPRINLTNIRSVILGDRWEGEVKISGNTVRVTTTRNGPTNDSARAPLVVTAERP
ncbi:MAG TPA: hypothetical protein VNY08_03285 [Bradyrhizobium sp.]|jgi:hypothetical protein|nr:hypothetical protein [Bradyrhizobium sp.]